MTDPEEKEDPAFRGRLYHLDLKRCPLTSCDGELAEMSYYERNNWVTIEYKCHRCGKEFTVKVEH